ncbi:MAG: homoserine O-acetyltransferase [Puniceicoccales bacterium]|jgi:homoserine O-acetyltransferase|nr:homoserine O-acetyltransferase [Puniceicoccales bacterium]
MTGNVHAGPAGGATRANEDGGVGIVTPRDYHHPAPFPLELGGILEQLTLRYETYGTLNSDASNAILLCHPLSGDHHAAGRHFHTDRKPGWWDPFIGPGRPFDTNRWFVIAVNCLGGCQGSTGPASINPATGRAWGVDFPQITLRDMVRAQRALIHSLGIHHLHSVAGGSMGGMQALLWAVDFPGESERVLAIACSYRLDAQAIAFNEIARNAILSDPEWRDGHYAADAGPRTGLAIARMLGHITYLSRANLERKFARRERPPHSPPPRTLLPGRAPFPIQYEVESYLNYQGSIFPDRFDANAYLHITKATDRFDLSEGRPLEEVFDRVRSTIHLIGFSSDWLYPPSCNAPLLDALRTTGKPHTATIIDTDTGHDSFLLPSPALSQALRMALEN